MLGVQGMDNLISGLGRIRRLVTLTQGEQSVLLAFFGVAFFGAALALNVVVTLGGQDALVHPFAAYDYWVVLSGAIGGCAGLYLGRGWMGWPGLRGIAFAIIGTLWISFLGGLVGGSLALPFYGTMFGPFTLFVSLFSAPLLALFWGGILIAGHFLLMIWRSERDSIFNAVLPDPTAQRLY